MRADINIEHIKYTKLFCKDIDGKNHELNAHVKYLKENEILINTTFLENIEISTEQEIKLNIVCIDGVYNLTTNIIKMENDRPYTFFYLKKPKQTEFQQKREYFRVLANYNCTYKLILNNEYTRYETKTYDISANGVSIILPEIIIPERDAEISININNKIVTPKVKYIRNEKINENYKLSFQFIEIIENERDYISQTCFKKQLEQRKNSLR